MAKKLVSRCRVWVDGKEVVYFKNFSEDEREIRKMVKLMSGHGTIDVEAPFKFTLDYVKPRGTPIDWDAFADGSVVVQLVGAEKIQFIDASTLVVGKWTADNENEIVQTITFGAEDRKVTNA